MIQNAWSKHIRSDDVSWFHGAQQIKIMVLWICFPIAILIDLCLQIINTPIFIIQMPILQFSSTIQQLNLRLQQVRFWPYQYYQWLGSKGIGAKQQAQYVGFWNTVWLIANDIILGVALCQFIQLNSTQLAVNGAEYFEIFDMHGIATAISWLKNWPAGLKLNGELSNFLGNLFTWMLYSWRTLMRLATPYLSSYVFFAGGMGLIGATFTVAIISDLLLVLTMHLSLLYIISARIYYWLLTILWPTFNIFRGRKYNPLRKRNDYTSFDLDQTLLGTILFTLIIFLIPTVAAYYLLFSLVIWCLT